MCVAHCFLGKNALSDSEIVKVKGNCLPAARASNVRRDATDGDVKALVTHLFFFPSLRASSELAKYHAQISQI